MLEVFDVTGNNLLYVEDSDTTALTVEVQFGNIFLGYEQITREFTEVVTALGAVAWAAANVNAGVDDQEEVDTLISIGYAPMEGVQLVVSSITTEITDLTNGEVTTLSGMFVGLAMAF